MRLLKIVIVLSLLLFVSPARAVIGVVLEASLPRVDAGGNQIPKRSLTRSPEAINKVDCEDDQQIRFPLTLSGFEANASLQAWASVAGVDCKSAVARSGANQICWEVVPAIPLASQVVVDIPVRKIIHGAPPFSASSPGGAPCGLVDRTDIAIHFLYFAPGQTAVPVETKTMMILADTVGPAAPTDVRTNPQLDAPGVNVSWAVSPATVGVQVYCAPLANMDGADAGAEAGTGDCSLSPAFGALPIDVNAVFDVRFNCASVTGNTASSANVSSTILQSGVRYVFTAAALDELENPSALSMPACASVSAATTPPASADADGCSASGSSSPTSPTSSLAMMIVTALAFLATARRGRRGRRSSRA